MSVFRVRTFLIYVWLLMALVGYAQKAVPEHGGRAGWVHDEAGILSPQTVAQLEAMLQIDRDSTSNQIAVLIVKNLDGGDIDEYANRVFNTWKLGAEKKDNGVLFLIAFEERQMRIEVGAGLEGVLTDMQSSRINRNEVAPYFRQGQYDQGIMQGVVGIMQTIKGEYKNDEPVTKRRMKRSGRSPWITVAIIVIFIILASRRRSGPGGGYWTAGGGYLGGGSWGGGGSSGSWGDFGGGGFSGGGGSSDSW